MVGAQENLLFRKEQDFERERGNQLISACLPLSLSIFFLFFSSKIPLLSLFFSLFLFLNTCFLFPGFEIPNPLMLSPLLYTAKDSLYSAYHDRNLLFWPSITFV